MAASKLTMKLLIDKKTNRVLFAEAGKDVIDFLFSLLSFPIGSVIKLLNKTNMVGCVANLYQSVENLDETYILQPTKTKELLLNPQIASSTPLNVPLLTPNDSAATPKAIYSCSGGSHHSRYTNDPNVSCASCLNYGRKMSSILTFVPSTTNTATVSASSEKGYVKEVVTYMVMDDLTVKPMSTISSITLLNKFNIENVSLLQEKVVALGMEQGLQILKSSLQTKNVLSQVFLAKKT